MIYLEVIHQPDYKKCLIAQKSLTMRLIKSGVPQCFVLSPLLFITHLGNFLFKLQHPTLQLFTDDTCLLLSNIRKKICKMKKKHFENFHLWIDANKLTLN